MEEKQKQQEELIQQMEMIELEKERRISFANDGGDSREALQ